jgi:ectoine hydroxylase-related dioxygenase (phytanoyl-CoA dioxygenase family)
MNAGPNDLTDLKRHFDEEGFLVFRSFLSREEVTAVKCELERYERDIAPGLPPTEIVWEKDTLQDGTRRVRNLWRLEKHDAYFAEFCANPEVLRMAAVMANGEVELAGAETFAKPARVGSVVPYHQDNAYFNLAPPDCFTLWIALDPSTLENGCVYYVPGSHTGQRLPHVASGVLGNSMKADAVPEGLREVPAVLEPGDAVIHHCMTIHRSEPNRSDRARLALVIVYRAKHCRIDPEAAQYYRNIASALQASST